MDAGPDLSAYGVDPVFKSGTDLYNNDLDDEADTVSFYNCSTLGYNATYNIPNTDTTLTVSTFSYCNSMLPCAGCFRDCNMSALLLHRTMLCLQCV